MARQEEQAAQVGTIKIMNSQKVNFRNHLCLEQTRRMPMQVGMRDVRPGCEDCHAQWRPRGTIENITS